MRGHYAVGVQSREQGEEGRMQCVATLQWASKVGNREKRVESSAWPLCSGLPMSAAECRAGRVQGKDSHRDARQSRRACRVQGGFSHRGARQNCRAGAPTRAIHALHSTLFSLLSTYHYPSKFDADIFRSVAVLEGDGGGFSIPPPDIQEIEDS